MDTYYFRKYLDVAPFALALWRAPEANFIRDGYAKVTNTDFSKQTTIKLKTPILDVGCGFGEFAGVFFDSQIEIGVDISIEDLLRAEKGEKYKKLVSADARHLPFSKNTFSTVISVSVLEHISTPKKCIQEAYRVLKPGGILILTIVTSDINNHLFYPPLLKKLGLYRVADEYIKYYHHIFKHITLYSPQKWKQIVEQAGFTIRLQRGTFSDKLVKAFDFFLLTALPSQVSRWLNGSRWVWGLSVKKRLLEPLYIWLTKETIMTKSNILIIAQKPDKNR